MSETFKQIQKRNGKKGGHARAKAMTKAARSTAARAAVTARWSKRKKTDRLTTKEN